MEGRTKDIPGSPAGSVPGTARAQASQVRAGGLGKTDGLRAGAEEADAGKGIRYRPEKALFPISLRLPPALRSCAHTHVHPHTALSVLTAILPC